DHDWGRTGWTDLLWDAGRQVVAVDLLGHGGAPSPSDPSAYDDLAGWLDTEIGVRCPGDEPLDAVGFSLGARTLLRLAIRRPERFGRLVLGGVGANLFTAEDREPLARAIESSEAEPEAGTGPFRVFLRLVAASGNDPRALAACLRRHDPPIVRAELGRVGIPVLLVLGERDPAGPGEPLRDALPDARLKVLPGVEHFATLSDFGFIDAALRFLEVG
ncbi:MAG: alpha/beta fold hydrolase, partial [Acidimicrobiales bacterium]